MNHFELLSFARAEELAQATATAWLDEIESARRMGQTHCVAFSGGRIAQKFFSAAAALAQARGVSFQNVHFFWADERCVPPTDADSNYRQAEEFFFQTVGNIKANQIHRIQGENIPQVAAQSAEEELRRIAGGGENHQPVLDLIILGMGEDGHVASLFPNAGREVWNCPALYLAVENSPKPPPRRISLGFLAIVGARQVWTLVSGAGKDAALRAALRSDGQTPLARVIRARTGTKIFADFNL